MCGSCPGGSRGLRRADTSQTFFAVNIYMYSRCSYGIKAKRASFPPQPGLARSWQGGEAALSAHGVCMHVPPLTAALVQRLHAPAHVPACPRGDTRAPRPGEGVGGGGMAQAGWGKLIVASSSGPKGCFGAVGRFCGVVLGGPAPRGGILWIQQSCRCMALVQSWWLSKWWLFWWRLGARFRQGTQEQGVMLQIGGSNFCGIMRGPAWRR